MVRRCDSWTSSCYIGSLPPKFSPSSPQKKQINQKVWLLVLIDQTRQNISQFEPLNIKVRYNGHQDPLLYNSEFTSDVSYTMGCLSALQRLMRDISPCATVKKPLHGWDQCAVYLWMFMLIVVLVLCYISVISFVPRTMYIGFFIVFWAT